MEKHNTEKHDSWSAKTFQKVSVNNCNSMKSTKLIEFYSSFGNEIDVEKSFHDSIGIVVVVGFDCHQSFQLVEGHNDVKHCR